MVSHKILDSKPLLIFINPNSGPGKSPSLFNSRIVPRLEEHDISYHAVITHSKGEAYHIVKNIARTGSHVEDGLINFRRSKSNIQTKNDDTQEDGDRLEQAYKYPVSADDEDKENVMPEAKHAKDATVNQDCSVKKDCISISDISFDSGLEFPYRAVICVSGDGTVYETYNGLMESGRGDVPVGVIPGGSGNGLACAIRWKRG